MYLILVHVVQHSLLIHLIAAECGLKVGEFIHSLGDFHIYHQHFEQVKIQLTREQKELPNLKFIPKNIFSYKTDDFELQNYDPHPTIKAAMNV